MVSLFQYALSIAHVWSERHISRNSSAFQTYCFVFPATYGKSFICFHFSLKRATKAALNHASVYDFFPIMELNRLRAQMGDPSWERKSNQNCNWTVQIFIWEFCDMTDVSVFGEKNNPKDLEFPLLFFQSGNLLWEGSRGHKKLFSCPFPVLVHKESCLS